MSQRPGITYIPFASTTCPCGRAIFDEASTLAIRLPSTTIVPRRSAPVETSMTVAFVIVRLWARRREPANASRRTSRDVTERIMSERHAADDAPVPIGLALPYRDIASAAASRRGSRTFRVHL